MLTSHNVFISHVRSEAQPEPEKNPPHSFSALVLFFLKQLKAKRLPGDTAAHLYAGLHECVKLDTANTTFEII